MGRVRKAAAAAAETAKRPGLKAFAEVAAELKGFQPARSVLRKIRSVPTIFPQFDWGTRVAGFPIERVTVVHGPSAHGKTTFAHGCGLSFLRRGHFYAFVDAEMTTPVTWLDDLFTSEVVDDPRFVALRPTTYEQTVDEVRRLCETIAETRDKKKIPSDTSALIVVDSIRKLVPKGIMERIDKMGADKSGGSIDGFGGRAAQLRAALNAAWMDELVPLMHSTGCAILLIARESEDPEADANARKYGKNWRLQGGRSIVYESSLRLRIQLAGKVRMGSDHTTPMIGERHRVDILKTKLSSQQDQYLRTHFHTSNGVFMPPGFDTARDLIELGESIGVVERPKSKSGNAGQWIVWGDHKWRGVNEAVKGLAEDSELMTELDRQVRELFSSREPVTITEDGEVIE